jgi:hypothetical protein
MEASLMKNRESLTIEHLTRIMLALVMNPRPISDKMGEALIS